MIFILKNNNNIKLSCDVPQPLFQKMPFKNGWYYVGSATQGRDYIMIQSQSFEARSRQGLVGLAQAPSPQESARILLFTTVSAQARPPTEEEGHEGMLRSGGASPVPGVGGLAQGPAP